jgi:hypothetical protein
MSLLKSLSFTVAPQQTERTPKLVRRQRLIERLEEKRKLFADPSFTLTVRRWTKDSEAVEQPLNVKKRVKPWWKTDAKGGTVLILKSDLKNIEIEKGKPAVVVGLLKSWRPFW